MVGTRGQHAGPGNIVQHRGASPGMRQMSGCLWLLAREQWSQCWGDGTPLGGRPEPHHTHSTHSPGHTGFHDADHAEDTSQKLTAPKSQESRNGHTGGAIGTP